MEWVTLDVGDITEHGSVSVSMAELARLAGDGEFRAHVAQIGPLGVLGRHPTRLWQLFYVLSGSGWVEGADGLRTDIGTAQAVLWGPGESHESGSSHGMAVLIVQSSLRPPLG